jgi:hypothetical protein
MAKMVKQKHGGSLKILEKGETANPNGRPRKTVALLKAQGYTIADIHSTIRSLLSMHLDELANVLKNENATILEKMIASSFIQGVKKGNLDPMEKMLTRTFGAPKETIDQTIEQVIKIVRVKSDGIK